MNSPQSRRGRSDYAEFSSLRVPGGSAVKNRSRLMLLFFAYCILHIAFCLLPSLSLSRAQTLSPRFETSIENSTRLSGRGEELRRRWNLDAAEAAFREALTLDPASIPAALGLSRIARARLDYVAAIRLLDRADRDHPGSADLLAERGEINLAAEETARAKQYFESALRIDSSNVTAIIGRAGVDLLERDYAGAETRLRDLVARNPNNSPAHAWLARALIESNRNKEAAAEAERAIALDEYDVNALGALAFIKGTERRPDEVRALARRAVALDSFNVSARRMLSQYLDGRTGYEQKVAIPARSHYERGRALKRDGKLAESVTEFEAALRVEPRYYRALLALGDVWLREGDYERAAVVARMAKEIDADGATAHLELSYAYRGLQERARINVGATDFAAQFYNKPAPPSFALTREIFPNYDSLTRHQQMVIDSAVAPLSDFLPALARSKARHYLLAFDEAVSDLGDFQEVAEEKTFDGRYYASIRGVGGRITVSGLEYIELAAQGGYHTIAHEFAHQVHMAALGKDDAKMIRRLYEQARRDGRALDYYAAANEFEYFAQGYEAFVSDHKRPSAGVTARHTNRELRMRDPELYAFLMKLTGRRHP
ncbi:MAG: tetratricopeptide repeat protein [Blastocatellia bacterium]